MKSVRFLSSLVLVTTACGDDGGSGNIDAPRIIDAADIDAPAPDAYVPDAQNYDFGCYQNAAPSTAEAMITISGNAQEAYLQGTSPGLRPSVGATITACTGDCTNAGDLGSTETSSTGTFTTASLTTSGAPFDVYLRATKANHRTTFVYPAAPLTENFTDAPVFLIAESLIPLLSFVGIDQDAGNSMLGVLVTDCSDVGIGGATVVVTQNGQPVGDAPVDGSALSDQASGTWFVPNVPPGDVTVGATYGGMTLRARVVRATADTVTATQVRPGY